MPPITAATIAAIARETGRSRTNRTVAASVLDVGRENSLELREANCAQPGSEKVSDGQVGCRRTEKALQKAPLDPFHGKSYAC